MSRIVPTGAAFVSAAIFLALASPTPAQPNVAQTIQYGEVVSAERATVVTKSTNTGAAVGATAGAVAGYALTSGSDRWLGGLLGGVIGGASGNAVEKAARKKKGWQLIIKVDSGQEIGVQIPGKKQEHFPGDRVRLLTGGGKTDVQKI
jgi:outer membrane lipoprotein SlyB